MAKAFKKSLTIDAVSLLSHFTGIARYTYEISKYIKKTERYDLYFNYTYPSRELKNNRTTKNLTGFKYFLKSNRYIRRYGKKTISLINTLFPKRYDLYWQPNIIPNPYIKAAKIVATVHDFSFLVYPESHPKERICFFEKNFFKEVVKSSHIITGSNFTKQEIINYLDFDPNNITVIYHGVDHNLYKIYPKVKLEKTKVKFSLPDKFFLFVGSIEPRKNLISLLKAYNLLDSLIQDSYPLILVGAKGWKNDDIMQEIDKSKQIRYLGYVEDKELPHLYNLATIFIYPSLYEGFGLPPLEAFACGTPSIVSNTTSMPEVCKDAALYLDPNNIYDIKDKIQILINDINLQKKLIDKALLRAKEFTWENSAKQHIKLFDRL